MSSMFNPRMSQERVPDRSSRNSSYATDITTRNKGKMMPTIIQRAVVSLAAAGILAFSPAGAKLAFSDTMPSDREALDAYIRDYIMNNPKILRDALLKLEHDEQTENTKSVLRGVKDELYHAGSPEIGNPDARVTIVEFYDYNCPYCRATHPELKEFLKRNPDTKLVFKDVAGLGKESEAVARIVIAATKQRKFEPLHDALMTQKGKVTGERALDIAKTLGLDVERLKEDAKSPETGETLTRAQNLANRLNVTATPFYIVGHQGIAGAPEDLVEQLTQHVEAIRETGCDVC